MHRLTFFVTIAAALVACGDDTGGAGGAGTGGGGQGGDAATTSTTSATTTSSSSSGEGGAGDGGGTTGTGGSDFTSLIAACEAFDEAAAPIAAELACGDVPTDCEGLPSQFPGCEAETETWLECSSTEITAADCECTDDDLVCASPEACTAESDALLACIGV